jgi:hypothetical protein
MSQWWTYTLQDFLLFSPRVYWRMFELHNRAVWPAQVPALLLGAAILVIVVKPWPWSGRVISGILAVAWIWVAWTFLWNRYSAINWAVAYAVPVFAVEVLLLGWIGLLRDRCAFAVRRSVSGAIGFVLIVETYRRDGVLSAAEVAALGEVTDSLPVSLRTGTSGGLTLYAETPISLSPGIPLSPGWSRFRCACRCPHPNMPARSTGTRRELKTSYFAPSQLAKAMT